MSYIKYWYIEIKPIIYTMQIYTFYKCKCMRDVNKMPTPLLYYICKYKYKCT